MNAIIPPVILGAFAALLATLYIQRERLDLDALYGSPTRVWWLYWPRSPLWMMPLALYVVLMFGVMLGGMFGASKASKPHEMSETRIARISAQMAEQEKSPLERDLEKKLADAKARGDKIQVLLYTLGLESERNNTAFRLRRKASHQAAEEIREENPAYSWLLLANVMLPLGVFAGLFAFIKHRKKHTTKAGYQGSARWAKWGEILVSRTPRWLVPIWANYSGNTERWSLASRLWLNIGRTYWAPPEGDAVCTHVLVLGATGSGKGFGLFNHVMQNCKTPVIYQDVKAECPMILHPRWRNAIRWGRSSEGGWPSMRWNPLQECYADPEPEDALMTLAAAIIPDAEGEGAWVTKIARPIFVELCMRMRPATLGDLADAILNIPLHDLVDQFDLPKGRRAMLEGKNMKEYTAGTFDSEMYPYRMGWGRTVTSGHDFSLDDIIDRGGYILSSETEELRKNPLKLFWNLLLRRLRRSAKPRPVTILMDEATGAGKIPNLKEALLELRNRKVSIWMGFQTRAAVDTVYGDKEAKTLLNAFGNRVNLIHGIAPEDAEALSKECGNWSKARGGHVSVGVGMSGPSLNISSGTDDQTAIPLITQTEILNRSRNSKERWAVIMGRDVTKKGDPILCMMAGSRDDLTRTPSPEEAEAELAKYRDPQPPPVGASWTGSARRIKCTFCDRVNPPDAQTCEGCGAPLEVHTPSSR